MSVMVEKGGTPIPNTVKTSSPSNSPTHYYKPEPAEIDYGQLRFLITDRPTDFSINSYIQELSKHSAKVVVRVCEKTYNTEPLLRDFEFEDGSFPPESILKSFLKLVVEQCHANPGGCIAVHCVAGLGRAPVLVAVALMEAGMKFEDSVEVIRKHRRGAINQKQLNALQKYKPHGVLKNVKNGKKEKDCSVM